MNRIATFLISTAIATTIFLPGDVASKQLMQSIGVKVPENLTPDRRPVKVFIVADQLNSCSIN